MRVKKRKSMERFTNHRKEKVYNATVTLHEFI